MVGGNTYWMDIQETIVNREVCIVEDNTTSAGETLLYIPGDC